MNDVQSWYLLEVADVSSSDGVAQFERTDP